MYRWHNRISHAGVLPTAITFFALFFLNIVHACNAAIVVDDDRGTQIQLQHPAQRIISLAPHITEILFAIGAGDKVVGVVSFSDYPEAAKKITHVGDSNRFDMERIVSLKPDLIVAWQSGNPSQSLAKFENYGIPVFVSEPKKLDDVAKDMLRLGTLSGTENVAKNAVHKYQQDLNTLREKYRARKKIRVFYEVWDTPLMTLNDQHIISETIRLCGGVNIFGAQHNLVPQIDMEAVLKLNPDVIINGNKHNTEQKWHKWKGMTAVARNNLFTISNPDILSRQSPRILLGAQEVCKDLDIAREHLGQ